MSSVSLVPFMDGHLVGFKARALDVEECLLTSGRCPRDAIKSAVTASSLCYSMLLDGIPVAFLGIVPLDDTWGSPWLLASEDATRFPKAFHKTCLDALGAFLEIRPSLINYVYSQNLTAIRWLRRLGFAVSPETVPYGLQSAPFHCFYRSSKLCVNQQP